MLLLVKANELPAVETVDSEVGDSRVALEDTETVTSVDDVCSGTAVDDSPGRLLEKGVEGVVSTVLLVAVVVAAAIESVEIADVDSSALAVVSSAVGEGLAELAVVSEAVSREVVSSNTVVMGGAGVVGCSDGCAPIHTA